jgi:hypothetical protein
MESRDRMEANIADILGGHVIGYLLASRGFSIQSRGSDEPFSFGVRFS